ncbi:MAG: protein translocase subunit SecD [Actinomycetales bacterium]
MSRKTRARRPLIALAVLIVSLVATLSAGVMWSTASFQPRLALDLAGGTQIILTPKVEAGSDAITTNSINQAIEIIRQRVDSSGVAEAEIVSQGGQNIVVSLPGDPAEQERAIQLVSQSAQMQFRPVIGEAAGGPISTDTGATDGAATDGTQTPTDPSTDGAVDPAADPAATEGAATDSGTVPAPVTSTDQRAVPPVLSATPAAGDAAATPDPNAVDPNAVVDPGAVDPNAVVDPGAAPETAATGTASDPAQVTDEMYQQFIALDCTDPANRLNGPGDPDTAIVTCSQDGAAKYVLGPVEVQGARISAASSGMGTNAQGGSTGQWVVNLEFDAEGADQFREVTTRLIGLQQPQNQFAIVLDGLVVSAPTTNAVITDGRAEISGSFTQQSASQLANQLKFGALPMSFTVESSEQISALLGSEQLRNGLLAGLIGLVLVVVYSLFQYRALGLVTVASLAVTGLLTYLAICLLGWAYGYRLSLPGVAGLIIAIGVTADSFIVYFERIRDEVREGRTLVAAVETGWTRARRTIIASDAINLLAAVVLYLLAVGGVRGFAFTLGLTTLLDLVVVMLFTHPLVSILARTRFFGGGHRLSGFDAEHLGRAPVYAGRGRVRTGSERMTIAERKAAQRRAEEAAAQEAAEADDSTGPDDSAEDGDLTAGARTARPAGTTSLTKEN